MNTYAAFGVGLGNLGRGSRPRIEQAVWIDDLNRELACMDGPPVVVVAAYGHTGNFVLKSEGDSDAVRRALARALDTGCAVLALIELRGLVEHLRVRLAESAEPGLRWTAGAALLVDGVAGASDPQGTPRAEYQRFDEGIVIVRKRDAVTPSGVLDRDRRMGGWGAVAGEVGRQLGGTWTARSVRTLAGTLRRGTQVP